MQDKVMNIIFSSLQERNDERADNDKFEFNEATVLFGTDGVLDSLDLVSTIVDIEISLASEFNRKISLSDDRAMSAEPVPFTSVSTLAGYIMKVLKE